MEANLKNNLGTNFFAKTSILLMLTFGALVALKIILSSCSVFSSSECYSSSKSSEDLKSEISQLQQTISRLEQSVSSLECPIEDPLPKETAQKINAPLWNEGNVEALSGCWSLDWDYRMRYVDTDEEVKVKSWNICFEKGKSAGKQNLSFDDNTTCVNQPISGNFTKNNNNSLLVLDDTKDVDCSGTTFIYHRNFTCKLSSDATHAMCSGRQRQKNGTWSGTKENAVKLTRSSK